MTFTNELQSILNHYGLGLSNGLDKVLNDVLPMNYRAS